MSEPTTIHDLPSELLSAILHEVLSQDRPQIRSTYKLLKQFATVSARFRDECARLLYENVYLYHEVVAGSFLRSERTGSQRVGALRVFGDLQWEGVVNGTARDVVEQALGVETLALWYFEGLDGEILEARSLSGLRSLLLSTDMSTSTDQAPLALPFRLQTLQLSNYPYHSDLVRSLLSSSTSTLRVLNLSSYGGSLGTIDKAIMDAFPLVAATIRELHLPPSTNPAFLPLLDLCQNLQSLTLDGHNSAHFIDTLLALPSSGELTKLTARLPDDDADINRMVLLFRLVGLDNFPALNNLEALVVHTGNTLSDTAEVRTDMILGVCAARGLRLTLER